MGKYLCFCSQPLVGKGSPMGINTPALVWCLWQCGESHGYEPHMGPLATQCHFNNSQCQFKGFRFLWSRRQSSLETPRTQIWPLSSYCHGCKTLAAPCELERVVAVEFLFGRGLGAALVGAWWQILKLCLHSRHYIYLDCNLGVLLAPPRARSF